MGDEDSNAEDGGRGEAVIKHKIKDLANGNIGFGFKPYLLSCALVICNWVKTMLCHQY
jgi:hypothetical protein